MDRIRSIEDLNQAKEEALRKKQEIEQKTKYQIKVSMASCGIAVGAADTLRTIQSLLATYPAEDIHVSQIGCLGLCSLEPVIQVFELNRPPVTYGRVTPEVAHRIFKEHIEKGLLVHEYVLEHF